MQLKWEGPLLGGNGYAEASRNYVGALLRAGACVIGRLTEPILSADFGSLGWLVKSCLGNNAGYRIKVISESPNFFQRRLEPGKRHIGLFFWETDRLPDQWVQDCELVDQVWVPCEWTRDVCLQSGVRVPVHVVSPGLDAAAFLDTQPFEIGGLDKTSYRFYSIFEWSTRKNPEGLLKAYIHEFSGSDEVVLLLKTFQFGYSADQQMTVRGLVDGLVRAAGKQNPPRILLDTNFRSRSEILWLHSVGDCFVLPHRGEGWGFPHFEACMTGKPVITTGFGANLEFTKPEHSYLVDFKRVPTTGMGHHQWYCGPMNWAEPSVDHLRKLLRHVFEHRVEAAEKGLQARSFLLKNFSWESSGHRMLEVLSRIDGT